MSLHKRSLYSKMRKNDLSLRAITSFIAVVECGGIARAARELGYSQPAVTLQLQQIEERLGVKLFERRQRRMELTEAGKQALKPARHLLAALAAFEHAVTRHTPAKTTPLVVGAIEPTASTKLPPILSAMRRALPDVAVKITIAGGDNIAQAAERGDVHAALTVPTQIRGWVYEPLFAERLVALVRTDHHLARQTSVSLSKIACEQLLLTDETCVYRRTLERAFLRYGIKRSHVIESSSLASLPNSVRAGLGIAIVPRPAADPIPADVRVVAIREPLDMTIGLLRPKAFDEESALGRFILSTYDLRKR